MTLFDTYNIIETEAKFQPNVNSVVPEFTDLNREDAKYTAIVIQQREHSRDEDFVTYNFYLGYVDRLNEKEDNRLEIQSVGIETLLNIIHALNQKWDTIDITNGQFIVFNQRFTAECAGVYTDIAVNVPISDCGIEYGLWKTEDVKEVFVPAGTVVTEVLPDDGYANIKKVIVKSDPIQDKKTVDIGVNGSYTVTPDGDSAAVREVELNVRVPVKVDLSIGSRFGFSSFTELPFDLWISDPYKFTDASGMFYRCNRLKEIPLFDTGRVTDMTQFAGYCYGLTDIPLFDTGRVENMTGMLQADSGLVSIPQFNTSNVNTMWGMFYSCFNLQEVPRLDTPTLTDASYMFLGCESLTTLGGFTGLKTDLDLSACTALTHDSLLNVINEAADVTADPKTLTLGEVNLAKLSDSEKALATAKGWILA